MALGTRSYARCYLSSGLPSVLRALLIAYVVIFLIQFFSRGSLDGLFRLLALRPVDVVTHLMILQLATYMFLHGGLGHILWNMLALWMFGREFEQLWGTRRFLRFYFFCGIG